MTSKESLPVWRGAEGKGVARPPHRRPTRPQATWRLESRHGQRFMNEASEDQQDTAAGVAVHRSGRCKTRGPGGSDSRKMGVLRMSKVEKPLVFKDSRV